ncbi:MAG TPA: metallophosphoesterase [Methanoregulaceae archaeon]|nr:metallophosphoesterase [Methanoregulaceae archaeon]HPD75337.1 metallophosphoesterase [Methanoregulaceae archaeon]HRY75913.1 metallophosphoesterase [Methanoregulaceae archaeon]
MNLCFLSEGPALLVQNRSRTLVFADLHIGIEADLAAHGWHIPSRSAERLDRLLSCIAAAEPDRVVLLGDVKHNLPVTTRQEYRELPGLLDALRRTVPLLVVPGNHDTGIARFLEPNELLPAEGAVIDDTGYFHGHTIPAPGLFGRLILAGHHHPLVSIRDEVGCSLRAPAYLLAGIDTAKLAVREKKHAKGGAGGVQEDDGTRVLFMPSFNEYAGFDVTRILDHPFSPISRALRRETAEVFLTDGTCLGNARMLEGPV